VSIFAASPAGLLLEIDVSELLPVAVHHDEAGIVVFLDGPGREESDGCSSKKNLHKRLRILTSRGVT